MDPNEAQKALAYLRSRGEGAALFAYLRAVVADGRAVIRSGQTIEYYRSLLAACERHLRDLAGDYEALLATYAWSIRLLRYYRAVPEAVPPRSATAASPAPVAARRPEVPRREPASSAPAPRPAAPELPDAGAVFTGPVLEVDESAVVVGVPGFPAERAVGVIAADDVQGRKYRVGNAARVEVVGLRTLKSGRVIVQLRPARREG